MRFYLATKGIVVGQALDSAPPRTATKDVVQPEPGILTTVTEVSASDFYQRVNKSSVPVLVQFWAPWCSCCKTIAPVIDDIARQFHGRVEVVRVNTDKNSQLVKQHGITSTPTFLIVHKGQVVDRIVGVQTREVFTEKLQSVQGCINSGA